MAKQPMLKFVSIERDMPKKRSATERAEDFKEIYAEFAAETRETMAWVLDQCMILLHPVMPFITEELWAQTGTRDRMLVHGAWPTYRVDDLVDAAADREVNWVVSLIEAIRSARAAGICTGLCDLKCFSMKWAFQGKHTGTPTPSACNGSVYLSQSHT